LPGGQIKKINILFITKFNNHKLFIKIMSRHFKNIHVGKSTVAVTGLGKSTVPAPLKIKIDPTNEEATTEIVQWGSDNLYPQNFYNKKILKTELLLVEVF
jgi:hypothetical protein